MSCNEFRMELVVITLIEYVGCDIGVLIGVFLLIMVVDWNYEVYTD